MTRHFKYMSFFAFKISRDVKYFRFDIFFFYNNLKYSCRLVSHLVNWNTLHVSINIIAKIYNLGLSRTRFNLVQRQDPGSRFPQRQDSGSRFPQRQDNNVRFPAERPQPSPASDKNGGLLGTVLGLLRPQNRPQSSAPGKPLFIFQEIPLGKFSLSTPS